MKLKECGLIKLFNNPRPSPIGHQYFPQIYQMMEKWNPSSLEKYFYKNTEWTFDQKMMSFIDDLQFF